MHDIRTALLLSLALVSACWLGVVTWPGSGMVWAPAQVTVMCMVFARRANRLLSHGLRPSVSAWILVMATAASWGLCFGYGGLDVVSFTWADALRFGVVGACVAYLSLVATLAITRRVRIDREAARESGRCPVCAYDLTGNVSGICPECGTAVSRPTKGTDRQKGRSGFR
jgi:hypothetical protein